MILINPFIYYWIMLHSWFATELIFKTVVRTRDLPFYQNFSAQYSTVNIRRTVVPQSSRTHFSCINEMLYSLSNSPFPPPSCLWQPQFHSLLLSLTFLIISYNWNHEVSVLLWLASPSIMSSRFIHALLWQDFLPF